MVKEENSRRAFFKKAAAAVGVVAAAGYTTTLIPKPSGSAEDLRAKYADVAIAQEQKLMQAPLVLMTDSEKKQMLDEMLNNYNKNKEPA